MDYIGIRLERIGECELQSKSGYQHSMFEGLCRESFFCNQNGAPSYPHWSSALREAALSQHTYCIIARSDLFIYDYSALDRLLAMLAMYSVFVCGCYWRSATFHIDMKVVHSKITG